MDARVHELLADAKLGAEALHRHAPVALEQLGVGLDPELAHVVARVDGEQPGGQEVGLLDGGCARRRQVKAVSRGRCGWRVAKPDVPRARKKAAYSHLYRDSEKSLRMGTVGMTEMTSGESMICRERGQSQRKFPQPRWGRSTSQTYLFLQVPPLESEHSSKNAENDKVLVVDELCGGEGRDRVEQELPALLEVADREEVQALVRLEPVATVPVTPLLNETDGKQQQGAVCQQVFAYLKGLVCGLGGDEWRRRNSQRSLVDVGLDDGVVGVEEADPDHRQAEVNL